MKKIFWLLAGAAVVLALVAFYGEEIDRWDSQASPALDSDWDCMTDYDCEKLEESRSTA